MSRSLFVPVKRVAAMLCMALAVMLSGQTYISLMDRIEHAHDHAHFANPLAGGIAFCGDHDACGQHPQHAHHQHNQSDKVSHGHDHGDGTKGDTNPNASLDHQHGTAPSVFLVAQIFVLPICAIPGGRCETEPRMLAGSSPRGPDHPPKPGPEIRV